MRLLNKTTLEFEWFVRDDAQPYIILSHRWHGAETTMKEFLEQRHLSPELQSYGTAKVVRFCKEVATHSVDYVWVDTVCIDKSSSAELQEAINSMYKWYENARLCMVYMDDVDTSAGRKVLEQQLTDSKWFTRGWTLQELLAPAEEVFLDREWRRIGTRNMLEDTIEQITGIRADCLGKKELIRSATVAERMSWVSLRETTRLEDMAYCMLGIFDVNMAMLYGEGPKAFTRLQKEIIRELDDESIFFWVPTPVTIGDLGPNSKMPVLAPHPSCFAFCSGLEIWNEVIWPRRPCQTTARGLEIELYETRRQQAAATEFTVYLNCMVEGRCAFFVIQRTPEARSKGSNQWYRVPSREIQTVTEDRVHATGPPMPMDGVNVNPRFTSTSDFSKHRFVHREHKEVFTVFIH